MVGIPKLRIEGFSDAWEQRKFGEIFSQTVNYVNPKTQNLELWSLTVQDGLTQKTERYNREFITKKDDKYKEVKVGEIVYNPMNMTLGAIDVNNIGKSVAVSGYYVTMVASESTYPYFIQTWMKSPQAILLYKNNATGTLKEKQRIQFTTLSKITSVIPSKAEQEKIGSFFLNLDNLITLHQRKCECLKNAKKFFLQNMFPSEGDVFPKLRIAGFTDAWEQRKLGDVFKEYSEKNHLELPPLTIIQGKGTVLREESDRNLQYDKSNLAGYKLVRKNDLIVHLRSFEGGLEKANTDGIVSPAYHMFHGDNTDTRFYYPFFRSKRFIDCLLKPHVYGIRDGKSIDIEGLKTIFIPVPSYEEQRKIGDFIESLDNLITLHQRKCDALKNAKKFFLQNMFV